MSSGIRSASLLGACRWVRPHRRTPRALLPRPGLALAAQELAEFASDAAAAIETDDPEAQATPAVPARHADLTRTSSA